MIKVKCHHNGDVSITMEGGIARWLLSVAGLKAGQIAARYQAREDYEVRDYWHELSDALCSACNKLTPR